MCFASSTQAEVLYECHLSGLQNAKLMQAYQPLLSRNGMEEDVKQTSLSERRGTIRLLLATCSKFWERGKVIRAGYLCRLPSPSDCHLILDVKNRQKLIIASVFKDAHTCSPQTRERGKKSILSGQVSVLSLSYLHTPTKLPLWEQDYRCTVCRANSSSPF